MDILFYGINFVILFGFVILMKSWFNKTKSQTAQVLYWVLGIGFVVFSSFNLIKPLLLQFLYAENSLLWDRDSIGSISAIMAIVIYAFIGGKYFKKKVTGHKRELANTDRGKLSDFENDAVTNDLTSNNEVVNEDGQNIISKKEEISRKKHSVKKTQYLIGGTIITIILLLVVGKCRNPIIIDEKITENDLFEDSLKKQKDNGTVSDDTEYFDSITKLYSNFNYRIAFDAPNNWATDAGVSEHTIFRTFQPDSGITFSINVIETKQSKPSEKDWDIWELYKANSKKMDYPFKELIPKQYNSKIKDFEAKKSYLKNQVALKRSFSYMIRDLDYEYSNTSIVYQTLIDNFTYTITLDVPTLFYKENQLYYEDLFRNIYFLLNKEDVNKFLNRE